MLFGLYGGLDVVHSSLLAALRSLEGWFNFCLSLSIPFNSITGNHVIHTIMHSGQRGSDLGLYGGLLRVFWEGVFSLM